MELLVFTENLVSKSVFYKGPSKSPLLFGIVISLHQVQIKGEFILHIVHIAGMRKIETGIDGISICNNLGGVMRGLQPLQFFPLGKGSTEISDTLEPWLRY